MNFVPAALATEAAASAVASGISKGDTATADEVITSR